MSGTELTTASKNLGFGAEWRRALSYSSETKFYELVKQETIYLKDLPNGHQDTAGNTYTTTFEPGTKAQHQTFRRSPNGQSELVAQFFSYPKRAEADHTYMLHTAATKRKAIEVYITETDGSQRHHIAINPINKDGHYNRIDNPSVFRRAFMARRILRARP